MPRDIPITLKRQAVARVAQLDFTIGPVTALPEEVLVRFPNMRGWLEAEQERNRKMEAAIRELVTAIRESPAQG